MPLYFIAIVAPEHINQQVLAWKHYMRDEFGCKVALKSPAHITLVPPFKSDHAELPALEFEPFIIHLKNFNAFKPRVIYVDVLPNEPLHRLKEIIYPEPRPFHPHVTIANRDLTEKDFPKAWQHFEKLTYEASFIADKISLLKHNGQHWIIVN